MKHIYMGYLNITINFIKIVKMYYIFNNKQKKKSIVYCIFFFKFLDIIFD